MWLVPAIAYFEYQATQSRLRREGKKAYRPLYIPNRQTVELSDNFIQETAKLDLVNVFADLRGADLVYACVARIYDAPLVTCDKHFERYRGTIAIINPVNDNE